MSIAGTVVVILVGVAGTITWLTWLGKSRARFIEHYAFPDAIAEKIRKRYPHLSNADLHRVNRGLREYFHVCRLGGRRQIAMPSQVIDAAWHEFILYTRTYGYFCSRALGRFLHHTPAEAMRGPRDAQEGIKRAWRLACLRERIDPKAPSRLPLLFAIDAELSIPDGFKYALNCVPGRNEYCATHIGCGGGCSGGHGCGTDGGCSGGCGGGGD